ncbi:hypothetical protein E0H26_13940 [Micromonospora zingiberis]|uniref:Uncharacterized protein n=1 Tax=Micromonospora zingiberis TaxID=2053011 RepID=A0A4R0GIX9_9ACTN|nr:hypothetical protein [Micromonospora zingiberis]TCB96727.1 hypothetical protein E0H26_13940 [Micromonospora zingiberis]
MEKWEYGQLYSAYVPGSPFAAGSDTVYLWLTATQQEVMSGHMLSLCDKLGAQGWLLDAPGPWFDTAPAWLVTAVGFDPARHSMKWTTQFARRKTM